MLLITVLKLSRKYKWIFLNPIVVSLIWSLSGAFNRWLYPGVNGNFLLWLFWVFACEPISCRFKHWNKHFRAHACRAWERKYIFLVATFCMCNHHLKQLFSSSSDWLYFTERVSWITIQTTSWFADIYQILSDVDNYN